MAEPESHFATVAPLDPRYGSGCYRRVILLNSPVAGVVEAALEDDPHAFSIRIEHDGAASTRARHDNYSCKTYPKRNITRNI